MREFMSYPEWEMSNRLQEPSAHNFFQEGGKWKNIKPTKRAILGNAKSFSLLESWHMVSYHNVQYYLQKTITQLPIIWKVSHYISFKLLQNEIQVQGKNETKKRHHSQCYNKKHMYNMIAQCASATLCIVL